MKIVRLIANLFTVPEIGQKIYRDHSDNYRQLIKNLKMLLEKKSDVHKNNVFVGLSILGTSGLCAKLPDQYPILRSRDASRQQRIQNSQEIAN